MLSHAQAFNFEFREVRRWREKVSCRDSKKERDGPELFVFAYVLSFCLARHFDLKTLPCE